MVSVMKMGSIIILVALLTCHTHTLTSWNGISWINMQFSVNQHVLFENTCIHLAETRFVSFEVFLVV
jgi:hypothetical protein